MKSKKSIDQIVNDFNKNEVDMPIEEVANFIQLNLNRRNSRNKIALTLLFLFLGAGILLIKTITYKKQVKLQAIKAETYTKLLKQPIKKAEPVNEIATKKIKKKSKINKAKKTNIDHSYDDLLTTAFIDVSIYNDVNKNNVLEDDISIYNNVNKPVIN